MGFKIGRSLISRFIYNREKREIKYRLGSIIVHLRRGQDVELIMRRTNYDLGGP